MRRRPESVGFRPSSVLPLPSSLCGLLLAGGCCACCRCCLRTLAEIIGSCGAAELFLGMRKGEYDFLSAHRLRTDKIVIGYPLAPRLSSCRNPAVFAVLFFNLYRSCCSVFSPGACVGLVCSESMNKVFVKRKLSGEIFVSLTSSKILRLGKMQINLLLHAAYSYLCISERRYIDRLRGGTCILPMPVERIILKTKDIQWLYNAVSWGCPTWVNRPFSTACPTPRRRRRIFLSVRSSPTWASSPFPTSGSFGSRRSTIPSGWFPPPSRSSISPDW